MNGALVLFSDGGDKWRVLYQKQVLKAGTSDYIPQLLWDVIICLCLWYLLMAQHSSNGLGGDHNIYQNWLHIFYIYIHACTRWSVILSSCYIPMKNEILTIELQMLYILSDLMCAIPYTVEGQVRYCIAKCRWIAVSVKINKG